MSADLSPGLQGLLLQAIGIVPLAFLTHLLSRSVRREYLRYWSHAWTSLAIALFALFVALRSPRMTIGLEPVYFVGEYVFGGLLIAGCRNLVRGTRLGPRDALLLVPAVALGLTLPHVHPDFRVRFIPQAGMMAVLFGFALWELRRTPPELSRRLGIRLLQVSLLALALSFVSYVALLGWAAWTGRELAAAYSSYTSLFDLLFETLLGSGTLIVVMEREHHELEQTNEELRAAREKLEVLARMDPLTSSLNRHAFYSMIEGSRTNDGGPGCVAIADVDGLKTINDTFGHAAGDAAIRAVARAIRQVVRADDLVFRWGGDEFLVVLFGASEEEVRRRLGALEPMLAAVPVPGSPEPLRVALSTGVAAFDSLKSLERSIDTADDRMYQQKAANRARVGPPRQ
jgi:diguanylate cyclase (GGDEF)-like protein